MLEKSGFEATDIGNSNAVEITVHAGEDHGNLLFNLHRAVLRLLQKFGQAAISRYWASSSFTEPATCFIALIWAAEPTRLTDRPTFTAGRMPL